MSQSGLELYLIRHPCRLNGHGPELSVGEFHSQHQKQAAAGVSIRGLFA